MLFIHKLPKKTFMALWAIVLCRLLAPFSIPSPFNIWNIADSLCAAWQKGAIPTTSATLPAPPLPYMPDIVVDRVIEPIMPQLTQITDIGQTPAQGIEFTAPSLMLSLWLIGIFICVLYFLITHLRCYCVYNTALPIENHFIKQWMALHPLERKVCVKQSDKVATPLTYGILRPVILLPETTDWQDKTRLVYILSHEYVHIRRFDTLLKWILAAALSMHWFNPLVWLMYVLANRDMELSCDEAVVRMHGENAKSIYALTLIGLEERRGMLMSLYSSFSRNAVEERVKAIMKIKRFSCIGVLAALMAVSSITLGVATTNALPSPEKSTAANKTDLANQTDNLQQPTAGISYSEQPEHLARMLFATKGETAVKVTYDGDTWQYYSCLLEDEEWSWYSSEEFSQLIERSESAAANNYLWSDIYQAEANKYKLAQTLEDIKNGIKVSKSKMIVVKEGAGPQSSLLSSAGTGYIFWYCFGYTFTDKAGNIVDLGLFETRSALFGALMSYYNEEVAAGRLTQTEANRLYIKIAHPVRNRDEIPLLNKLTSDKYWFYILSCGG
jgi:beta-lactamase regulating signal transducer with metallopeptidase domain